MLITPNKQNNQNLRPPTNDRTCIGWHERYGGVLPCLEGHLRPEALNLTAWNLMLMDSTKNISNEANRRTTQHNSAQTHHRATQQQRPHHLAHSLSLLSGKTPKIFIPQCCSGVAWAFVPLTALVGILQFRKVKFRCRAGPSVREKPSGCVAAARL